MTVVLTIPNLDRIQKENAPLGEALQKVQKYINQGVTPPTGNRKAPPTFVTPSQKQG